MLRRSDWLPRLSVKGSSSDYKRLRIDLPRRKVARARETLRAGFFLNVKCPYGCPFIYRYAVGDELSVLRSTLQRHIWPEEALDELAFLILSMGKRESNREQ